MASLLSVLFGIVNVWLIASVATSPTRPPSSAAASDWSQLTLFTIFSEMPKWKQVKATVGGIHRLAIADGDEPKVPAILIFLPCHTMDKQRQLEVTAWKGVHVSCVENETKEQLMIRILQQHSHVAWFDSRYVFDPEAVKIKRAEMLGESKLIKEAIESGKSVILGLLKQIQENKHIKLFSKENALVLEGRMNMRASQPITVTNTFGLVPSQSASVALACHVVLKKQAILDGATLAYPKYFEISTSKKLVAIGVPTTSKGMKRDEEPVFLKALLPSMMKTLSKKEIEEFHIVVFVGFDCNDPYFDNVTTLKRIHHQVQTKYPAIDLVFLRLLPLERVAMTWNMIFAFARKTANFDFFYQVNDDLTMVTAGWLTAFTQTLYESSGLGVVGPSDNFNGFACSLLTQAMVAERHFQSFSGLLYPLVFRDWKSDRWLSFVYGQSRTHCWQQIEANNGAKGTRYTACTFDSWRVVLDATQQRIK